MTKQELTDQIVSDVMSKTKASGKQAQDIVVDIVVSVIEKLVEDCYKFLTSGKLHDPGPIKKMLLKNMIRKKCPDKATLDKYGDVIYSSILEQGNRVSNEQLKGMLDPGPSV